MSARARLVLPCLALALAAGSAGAANLTEAEKDAICREAADRYQAEFGTAPKAEPVRVILTYKNLFCPRLATVTRGERVRFVNVDRRTSHSVWFRDAGQAESDRFFPKEQHEVTVDLPEGEHEYLCGPHWEREGMIGRLIVSGERK
jgi:plastocyanin